MCIGLGWDRINFLQINPYGAAFWIFDPNSADYTPVFELLLRGLAWCGDFCLCHSAKQPPHPTEGVGGTQEAGRRHKWDSLPQLTKRIFLSNGVMLTAGGKEEGRACRVTVSVFPINSKTQ